MVVSNPTHTCHRLGFILGKINQLHVGMVIPSHHLASSYSSTFKVHLCLDNVWIWIQSQSLKWLLLNSSIEVENLQCVTKWVTKMQSIKRWEGYINNKTPHFYNFSGGKIQYHNDINIWHLILHLTHMQLSNFYFHHVFNLKCEGDLGLNVSFSKTNDSILRIIPNFATSQAHIMKRTNNRI